ncbi:hypothetical protein CRYUN_Cryun02cG0047700 [Craigia yunnanensis]
MFEAKFSTVYHFEGKSVANISRLFYFTGFSRVKDSSCCWTWFASCSSSAKTFVVASV